MNECVSFCRHFLSFCLSTLYITNVGICWWLVLRTKNYWRYENIVYIDHWFIFQIPSFGDYLTKLSSSHKNLFNWCELNSSSTNLLITNDFTKRLERRVYNDSRPALSREKYLVLMGRKKYDISIKSEKYKKNHCMEIKLFHKQQTLFMV